MGDKEAGSRLTEEEISMVLDTYMYMNYKEADDGMTLSEIISGLLEIPEYTEGGIHYGEYQVLSNAVKNPEIGELVIGNQSHYMGYNTGTAACTFSSKNQSSIYVVYRGTGDGEWMDNGIGMTQAATPQQEQALHYFEAVVEREKVTGGQRLIVTGHSKGGNKAQYVTMATKYEKLLDACYNIDGQGFSEKAIDGWKESYGEKGYLERTKKITGIYGENDFIHVLGNRIVPENQISYIKTPVKPGNLAGYHDIKYMFSELRSNPVTGKTESVFHGRKNGYAVSLGEIGFYVAGISSEMMMLEEDKRDGCAAFMMQMMELGGDEKTGLNGEKLTISDIWDFFSKGIPSVAAGVIHAGEYRKEHPSIGMRENLSGAMMGRLTVFTEYFGLSSQAARLLHMAGKLNGYCEQMQDIRIKLKNVMKGQWMIDTALGLELERLEREKNELEHLSGQLQEIIQIYMQCDEAFLELL